MKSTNGNGAKSEVNGTIRCIECAHFRYFQNDEGHNTPSALGECGVKSWDGNQGQWPMLPHPCGRFEKTDQPAVLSILEVENDGSGQLSV